MAADWSGQDDSSSDEYDEDNAVCLRDLQKDSILKQCRFISTATGCTNASCKYAHSQEELDQWRDQLLSMTREYVPHHHKLKLCKSLDENAKNKYCTNGVSCGFAHSQEELDYWSGIAKPKQLRTQYSSAPATTRKLKEDSLLALCDYKPKCKKGDDCKRAHSEEELEHWKKALQDTVRDKSDQHHLKLCTAPNGCCKSGLRCKFAHSQRELDAWNRSMPCRLSEGKLLEMCRNGEKCKFRNSCKYAHNEKELASWKEEHRQNYLRSAESIPERCSYTIPIPTCQRGTCCPYAHSEEERKELILSLQTYDKVIPRPIPRVDKLLPYTLCDNHCNEKKSLNDECIYGSRCKQAHSQKELDAWERQRRTAEEEDFAVRPFDPWVSQLKKCGQAVRCGAGRNCPCAHSSEELRMWKQARRSKIPMLGPIKIEDSSCDPFLISLIDFQWKFSGKLATVLNAVIRKAANDVSFKEELGKFIDYSRTKIDLSSSEGQQSASLFDLQYLLGYMQRNAATLAVFLGVEEGYLFGLVADLLEMRNLLAHGLYKGGALEESTEKFVHKGLAFVGHIMKSNVGDEDDQIRKGYADLLYLQTTLRDFLSYQRESIRREGRYSTLSPDGKKGEAHKALRRLQELCQAEQEPGIVTKFLATSLGARFPL